MKKERVFKIEFNCLYIALIILWQIIQYYIGVDGKGRIPFVATIGYFAYSLIVNRKTLFATPLWIWWIWVPYALINTFFIQKSPMPASDIMGFCTSVIAGPLLISAITKLYSKNKSLCFKFVGYVLLLYMLFALTVTYDNPDEYVGGHGVSVFGNIVPISIVIMSFVFSVRFVRREISFLYYITVVIFSVSIIVLSATRKAFGGVLIVIGVTYLSSLKQISPKAVFSVLIMGLMLYVISEYVTTTTLWSRFSSSHEQSSQGEYSGNWFLVLVGDRAVMYDLGWKLFLDNKWFGIGLRNFVNKGYLSYTLHTEYMVQLTECGIVGTSFFLWFYGMILYYLVKLMRKSREYALVCLGGLMAIMFIELTAWAYNQPVYFIGLGVIISLARGGRKKLILRVNDGVKDDKKIIYDDDK